MATSHDRVDSAELLVPSDPPDVFAAFVEPDAVEAWLPPRGMSARVLEYDFRPGGAFRIELSYPEDGPGRGKTTSHSDITVGAFVSIEWHHRIVESVEFEAADAAYAGHMLLTWTLKPDPGGTLVGVRAEHVPPGISATDHAAGLTSTLANLAHHLGHRGRD